MNITLRVGPRYWHISIGLLLSGNEQPQVNTARSLLFDTWPHADVNCVDVVLRAMFEATYVNVTVEM